MPARRGTARPALLVLFLATAACASAAAYSVDYDFMVFWAGAMTLLVIALAVETGWRPGQADEAMEAVDGAAPAETDVMVRLLDDAVAQAERQPPRNVRPIDLSLLLARATSRLGRTDFVAPRSALHTIGEASAIERLFEILISNALSNGSRATIRMDHGTSAIAIHVDDDGPGVPRAERDLVFKRRRTSYSGAWHDSCFEARQIALAHEGDVTISSSPEGGGRFTVRLPLTSAAPGKPMSFAAAG